MRLANRGSNDEDEELEIAWAFPMANWLAKGFFYNRVVEAKPTVEERLAMMEMVTTAEGMATLKYQRSDNGKVIPIERKLDGSAKIRLPYGYYFPIGGQRVRRLCVQSWLLSTSQSQDDVHFFPTTPSSSTQDNRHRIDVDMTELPEFCVQMASAFVKGSTGLVSLAQQLISPVRSSLCVCVCVCVFSGFG